MVTSVACNELYAVVGCTDGTISIWEFERGKRIQTIRAHRSFVWAVACTSDLALTAGSDRSIKMWTLSRGAFAGNLATRLPTAISSLACNATTVFAGDTLGVLRAWPKPRSRRWMVLAWMRVRPKPFPPMYV